MAAKNKEEAKEDLEKNKPGREQPVFIISDVLYDHGKRKTMTTGNVFPLFCLY